LQMLRASARQNIQGCCKSKSISTSIGFDLL